MDDTSSIQYRPKGIFGNSKGWYYKNKKERIYLSPEEVEEMMEYISEAFKYLKNDI